VRRALAAVCALAAASVLAGCRQDMQDQPKFVPQRGTDFYVDGRSARPQVENTVARGQLREDAYFYTGMQGGKEGDGMPFPVTMEVLERGQERYNVYCTPCHSRVGNGVGMIVQRGYSKAGNFHTARLQAAPLGHFFSVMTHGYGSMPDYSAQLSAQDRWAVVAYIKALQLSQAAKPTDAPAGAQVAPLGSIAEAEGLPASFADEWTLPPTAEAGTPDGGLYKLPESLIGQPETPLPNPAPPAGKQ
jgi:cytochrome c553